MATKGQEGTKTGREIFSGLASDWEIVNQKSESSTNRHSINFARDNLRSDPELRTGSAICSSLFVPPDPDLPIFRLAASFNHSLRERIVFRLGDFGLFI